MLSETLTKIRKIPQPNIKGFHKDIPKISHAFDLIYIMLVCISQPVSKKRYQYRNMYEVCLEMMLSSELRS